MRFRLVPKSKTLDDLEGCIQGLPNDFKYPLLCQERVKLRTSNLAGTFLGSIRTKAYYTFWRKGSVDVSRDCPKFLSTPYHRLCGSVSTVVTMTSKVNGKTEISTPVDIEAKIGVNDYAMDPYKLANLCGNRSKEVCSPYC